MTKKINMFYKNLTLFFGVALIFAGCADGDNVIDNITENVTRGAVLRQVEVISNSVAINSGTNELEDGEEFAVVLEEQDVESGGLLNNVEVYVGFVDNTTDGANSIGEVLAETIPASEFSTGEFGLPRIEYRISAQEMQSALGLASSNIGLGGDQFTVRFVLNLTDGRSFSNGDNSGTLTGSYYNSPFLNSVSVVCAPSVPTAGTWNVRTVDSYGDGWNGGFITVVIDDGAIPDITNTDSGGPYPAEIVQDYEFTVPEGASTISVKYTGGSFDEEVSFTVTSANGNVVADQGPEPTTGTELLDYCKDNL